MKASGHQDADKALEASRNGHRVTAPSQKSAYFASFTLSHFWFAIPQLVLQAD